MSLKVFALWFVAALLAWPAVVLVSPGGADSAGDRPGLALAVDARGAVAVLTGEGTGPQSGLRWGMVLTIVQIAAVALLVIAGWRLFDQWRTGTLAHAGDRSQGQWPPKAGQVWYADVPFQEGDGESKDRPVLVVRTGRRHAEVLKITSQDKSRHPEHYLFLPYPKWRQVLDKNSWLELRPVTLDYHRFHNLRGLARYGTVRTVRARVKPRPAS